MDELRFKIGTEELPFPSMESLTLGEGVVINLVTGLSLEDYAEAARDTRLAAMMAVALQRAHSDWTPGKIADIIRNFKYNDLQVLGLPEVAEEPVPPPESNSEPTESTDSKADVSESVRLSV